jgi:cobalt-zinc-cadmium efflux system outer membrane protein
MLARYRDWIVVLGLLPGGCHSLPDHSDATVLSLASLPRDVEPLRPAGPEPNPSAPRAGEGMNRGRAQDTGGTTDKARNETAQIAFTQTDQTQPPVPLRRRLEIPLGLPGAKSPPLRLPKAPPDRDRALAKLYPPLAPLQAPPQPAPGPDGRPLTLADLQRIAAVHNPSIKNAVAAVEAARGAVIQAGAYPNPSFVWAADTVGTGGAGYQGGGFDQPIKGANKVRLQKAMAQMDLQNSELALKRAQSDLATQVRSNYFAVLVALENMRISLALARFAEEIYDVQLDLLRAGEAAPYEPMQLRPLVAQARFNLLQAANQYIASWKQLAAALGLPAFPPTELAGQVDLPVPVFEYKEVLARVLSQHTDVVTAMNSLQRSRYAYELAQVTPFPDFDMRFLLQKDYTTGPSSASHELVYSGELSFPIPLWDRNKGNIIQAAQQLTQARLQPEQTRLQLTSSLADAFNRYETNRAQVRITLEQIEDQVRAYRGVYERRQQTAGEVSFGDLVTAQQTLAAYIASYITALGLQWTAVVDIANLLQTDDLFQAGPQEPVVPIPDLEESLGSCFGNPVPQPASRPPAGRQPHP